MKTVQSSETVLVVDDQAENIDILVSILSPYYRVKGAVTGKQAIEIMHSEDPPDLVLLDIVMPTIDGFEIAKKMKDDKILQGIPIIFVTGEDTKESIVQGFKIGAKDYVTKPFNPAELLARVATHLELIRQRQQVNTINQRLEATVKERTQQLEISLRGKEKLLQELHHRVNNNLQILSSLVKLQMRDTDHPKTIRVMKSFLARMQTIAFVHQMIQSEEDLLGIDFGVYVRDIIKSISGSVDAKQDNILFEMNIDTIFINANTAIPCGLILNELIFYLIESQEDNSVEKKYRIECYGTVEDHYQLSVTHNGMPIKENDWNNSSNFRLKVVSLLTEQLRGTLAYDEKKQIILLTFENPPIKTFNPVK